MKHIKLPANSLSTINWYGNNIIDWASAGTVYSMDGSVRKLYQNNYSPFDRAIMSDNGEYAFVYQNLQTKGLLLKNGQLLREINRSYYCAEVYEYPAAFLTFKGKTYLIHCPISYDRLDIEDVETGQLITEVPGRKPVDIFHSRLELSPDKLTLMCKSWVWHPVEMIEIFNITDCMNDPCLLDVYYKDMPAGAEICTASFIDNDHILIGTSDEEYGDEERPALFAHNTAIWNFKTRQLSKLTTVEVPFGNLFAIDEHTAWDLYKYPKVIDTRTGKIIDKMQGINSGEQQGTIIRGLDNCPQIVFNRETKSIAVAGNELIHVLTL